MCAYKKRLWPWLLSGAVSRSHASTKKLTFIPCRRQEFGSRASSQISFKDVKTAERCAKKPSRQYLVFMTRYNLHLQIEIYPRFAPQSLCSKFQLLEPWNELRRDLELCELVRVMNIIRVRTGVVHFCVSRIGYWFYFKFCFGWLKLCFDYIRIIVIRSEFWI